MVDISIVIRAKNEAKNIVKTLDMVFKQKIEKEFEVVIVDSGSTDSTLDIASSYGCRIVKIPPEKFTYPYALNVGTRNARGKYIVYLSAHSPPVNEEWLYHLIKHFKDPLVAGVYGRQIPIKGLNPIEEEMLLRSFPISGKSLCIFSNANGAIKKDIWKKYPFDETTPLKAKKFPMVEDQTWAKKMVEKGYKIIYEPESIIYHSHPFNFIDVYKRGYSWGYFSKEVESKPGSTEGLFRNIFNTIYYLSKNYYIAALIIYPLYGLILYYGFMKGERDQKKQ